MKRRMFLSTAGTVGAVGAVSGATVVSSAFTSISTSVSLAEFSRSTKTALDNFAAQLTQNIKELDLPKDLAESIALPVRIIKKNFEKDNHSVVYKNKTGKYVSLTIKKGVETIRISDTL